MATRLFIATKDFRKQQKSYRSNIQITPCGRQILTIAKKSRINNKMHINIHHQITHCSHQILIIEKSKTSNKIHIYIRHQITPCGHQILTIAKNLEQIAKCIFTSIIKLHLMNTNFFTTTKNKME